MKYQRKPAVVEAFRFDTDSEVTAPEWFLKEVQKENVFIDRCITDGAARVYGCTIYGKYGRARAKVGDYIIREPSGEIQLSKAKDFNEEYERI